MKTIIIYLGQGDNYSGSENNIREIDFTHSFGQKLFKRIEELGGESVLIDDIHDLVHFKLIGHEFRQKGLIISIHVNACEGSGFEIHNSDSSYNGTTKDFVDSVYYAYKSVADRWCIPGLPDRGLKADSATQSKKLDVFQDIDMPICVLEAGALDHDVSTIMNKAFQKEAADSLAPGH